MAEEQLTKCCIDCKTHKPLDEFHKSSSNKFGVNSRCKICRSINLQTDSVKMVRSKYWDSIKDLDKTKEREKNRDRGNYYQNFEASEHRKEYLKKRRESEEYKRYHSEYRKTDKAKAVDKNKRYMRRTKTKKGDVTSNQILELEQNAKNCYWCGVSLKNVKVHVDHYSPLCKDGEHTLSNLVVSCAKCNLHKHAKDPYLFANSIGRLL